MTPTNQANILVVDDDESMRYLLQTKLFKAGYSVTLAASGSHAMQIFQTGKKFDLILCDLRMPSKSGIDVIKFMRDGGNQTPVVLLTGYPDREKIIAAARMGIQDVLVKPVRHNDLMEMIRSKLKPTDGEEIERAS